jgi:carboxylesterase type B
MVYMHGGGFAGGSGNDLLCYDGENLARHHDVVVVTHNHRLNLFGYLNLAEIGGERYAASGNVGMLDIVAVLEWVRDNMTPGCAHVWGYWRKSLVDLVLRLFQTKGFCLQVIENK